MPPRSYKRRRGYGTRRLYKRRRTGFGFRRRFGGSRSKIFKRFRRRFRRSRFNRRLSSVRRRRVRFSTRNGRRKRDRLAFTLAPINSLTFTYGQAVEVPDALSGIESRYFVPEIYLAGGTPDTVQTVPLCGIYDVNQIANRLWATWPTTADATINTAPKPDYDWLAGSLFIKGKDTYTIRNQTNEDVVIEAFHCVLRKDYHQNDGGTQNIYKLLGRGYAERGFDSTSGGAFNAGLYRADLTPFDSTLFTRVVKITRRYKFKIKPGEYKNRYLATSWRRYRPIEYITPSDATTNNSWSQQTQMYDFLKGSKFILFRVFGNSSMKPGQPEDAWSREIAQTTPLVIMSTARHYQAKHIPLPPAGLVTFTASGVVIDAGGVIMGDSTKVEMKEAEAE